MHPIGEISLYFLPRDTARSKRKSLESEVISLPRQKRCPHWNTPVPVKFLFMTFTFLQAPFSKFMWLPRPTHFIFAGHCQGMVHATSAIFIPPQQSIPNRHAISPMFPLVDICRSDNPPSWDFIIATLWFPDKTPGHIM